MSIEKGKSSVVTLKGPGDLYEKSFSVYHRHRAEAAFKLRRLREEEGGCLRSSFPTSGRNRCPGPPGLTTLLIFATVELT